MELVEIMSPHVIVPVIGVILFAFVVFALGFRTPVQPPSFSYVDEEPEKRSKKKPKTPKVSFLLLKEGREIDL